MKRGSRKLQTMLIRARDYGVKIRAHGAVIQPIMDALQSLNDLHDDLGLDEWAKDDHPHAILARAHAVGALPRRVTSPNATRE